METRRLLFWKYQYHSFFLSKLIFELSFKYESEFFEYFLPIFFLFIRRHLIEYYFPIWLEEGFCPDENISDISCRTWYHKVIFFTMICVFGEYFCAFLNSSNILESKLCNKMIHCFYFFPNWVKKCHLKFWQHDLKWNTRKSSSWSNIKKSDWVISSWLHDNTCSIEGIDKMFFDNSLRIADRWKICMRIISTEKSEESFKYKIFFRRKIKMMKAKNFLIHILDHRDSQKECKWKYLQIYINIYNTAQCASMPLSHIGYRKFLSSLL